MKCSNALFAAGALCLALGAAAPVAAQATAFTIENASMALSGATIPGWDTTSAESRDNGPYNGTVSHQAIDSPLDPNAGSGSLVFEFTNASGSLTQQILLNTAGQEMESFSVEIAHDGQCGALLVGLYQENVWDVLAGGFVDVIDAGVPADTDGTLDTFTTVTVPMFTVDNSSGNPMRLFIGTAGGSAYGQGVVGAKVAVDYVRLENQPASVTEWTLYN
ncbi:MAG: hypothetical protein PWP23_2059 [Candidatus Sumerlaeota bacterium]|nr:hypothetical protein [Candidatus Sumerlaeota bacterium]